MGRWLGFSLIIIYVYQSHKTYLLHLVQAATPSSKSSSLCICSPSNSIHSSHFFNLKTVVPPSPKINRTFSFLCHVCSGDSVTSDDGKTVPTQARSTSLRPPSSRLRFWAFSSMFCEVNNESWWELPTFYMFYFECWDFEFLLMGTEEI